MNLIGASRSTAAAYAGSVACRLRHHSIRPPFSTPIYSTPRRSCRASASPCSRTALGVPQGCRRNLVKGYQATEPEPPPVPEPRRKPSRSPSQGGQSERRPRPPPSRHNRKRNRSGPIPRRTTVAADCGQRRMCRNARARWWPVSALDKPLMHFTSAVDLKFLSVVRRVRHRNFKSKTALESESR